MPTIEQLLTALDDDQWRKTHPFVSDIKTACEVLLNPHSRGDERKIAIRGWLNKNQPCVFGGVAAKTDRLFISIVDDALLSRGDQAVQDKLTQDKRTWKQWSLGEKGRHGFLVAVISPKLHFAAPNQALKQFSEHVRELFAADTQDDVVGNDMAYEWLYLRKPQTDQYHKFRVILDFFASAGDGRWWHDHRFPGGIAFTFNSLGHMARTKEWYEKNKNPVEWAARMAMLTISNAYQHPEHGKATSLLNLNNGHARKSMKCPFSNVQTLPPTIQGKDWTTYQGDHHTDHSIRAEFFDGHEMPDKSKGPYLLDFAYISGDNGGENLELMNGLVVGKEEVERDIGTIEEWRFARPGERASSDEDGGEEPVQIAIDSTSDGEIDPRQVRPREDEMKILAALETSKEWLKSDWD